MTLIQSLACDVCFTVIYFNKYLGRYPEKNGGRSNCSAWMGLVPEHGVGVVVVTNCGGPSIHPIGRCLLERSVPGAYRGIDAKLES